MTKERSFSTVLSRFLDSFLHERSIQWLLGIGVGLLVGSSLMLVKEHWESWTPLWKHLVFLLYTSVIWLAAEATFHRFGLRRTGTALSALVVVLVPVTFVDLAYVERGFLPLFFLQATLGWMATRRLLEVLLRGQQPTFFISYFLLAAAGTFAPLVPTLYQPWALAALWVLFSVGVTKVTRHLFWLGEEGRLPRIFGFFPVVLLGSQFLTLAGVYLGNFLTVPWCGFLLTVTAAPVFLTADAVVHVFQQRTGDLVRPLPWPIVCPLVAAVVMVMCGLVLTVIPPDLTGGEVVVGYRALVPSAVVGALLLGAVARRTGTVSFVWGALLCGTLAYNFSPVYFRELAQTLIAGGARAVREPSLPFSFYGVTYLPWLAGCALVAARLRRRGVARLALPLEQFCAVLGVLLLVVALGHEKALLPVGAALSLLFGGFSVAFNERRWLAVGCCAATLAVTGAYDFVTGVFGSQAFGSPFSWLAGWLLLASWGAPHFDRQWPRASSESPAEPPGGFLASVFQRRPTYHTILALTFLVAVAWLMSWAWQPGQRPWLGAEFGILTCLLTVQALRSRSSFCGGAVLVFVAVGASQIAWSVAMPLDAFLHRAVCSFVAVWSLGRFLERRSHSRLAQAFTAPSLYLPVGPLLFALVFVFVPHRVGDLLGSNAGPSALSGASGLLLVGWALAAACRFRSDALAYLGWVCAVGLLGSALVAYLGDAVRPWLPAIAAGIGAVVLSVDAARRSSEGVDRALTPSVRFLPATPLARLALTVLVMVTCYSLSYLSVPMRVAGLIACAGGLRRCGRVPALVLLNIHLLLGLAVLVWPPLTVVFQLLGGGRVALPPVAFAAMVSLFIWTRATPQDSSSIVEFHRLVLRLLTGCALLVCLSLSKLTPIQAALVTGTFLLAASSEVWSALRRQWESRVWSAQIVLVALVGYLWWFDWIHFGQGKTMYAVLLCGLAFFSGSQLARGKGRLEVFCWPLRRSGMALPGIAAGLAVLRHFHYEPTWIGFHSLPVLVASAFYFWRGRVEQRCGLVVLAAAIFNVSVVAFWRDLGLRDAQLYMVPCGLSILLLVELLKKEIPPLYHDPLRYLGALVILVSPVFGMLDGGWLHHFTLLVLSVGLVVLAIGLRTRVLLYVGTAFLFADLAAMVVRGSLHDRNVLWGTGVGLGLLVLLVAGLCENRRGVIEARVRRLSSVLETWH